MSSLDERVKTRRVQRLGTSSLVVTLPKEWVRKVGLKPGDQVMIIVEGNSVRVIPAKAYREALQPVEIDYTKLPPDFGISRLVSCAYVARVDAVTVKNVGWEAALEARSMASKLAGVDVISGANQIEIRCVVDETKFRTESLIESLLRLAIDLTGLTEKLLTEPTQSAINLVRETRAEIIKYEHIVGRRATSLYLEADSISMAKLYAACHLGRTVADLWHLANYIATLAETKGKIDEVNEIKEMIREMRTLFEKFSKWVSEPVEQLVGFINEIQSVVLNMWQRVVKAEKPLTAAIAAMAHTVVRGLMHAANVLACCRMLEHILLGPQK